MKMTVYKKIAKKETFCLDFNSRLDHFTPSTQIWTKGFRVDPSVNIAILANPNISEACSGQRC